MSPHDQNLKRQAVELASVARLRSALRRFQAATDEVTRRHRLTPGQYDLLALLHDPSRAESSTTALADSLGLSRNSMSELVTRAVAAGLVRRTADARDGRRKPLVPTALGTRRFLAAVADLRPERDELVSMLREATGHARGLRPR